MQSDVNSKIFFFTKVFDSKYSYMLIKCIYLFENIEIKFAIILRLENLTKLLNLKRSCYAQKTFRGRGRIRGSALTLTSSGISHKHSLGEGLNGLTKCGRPEGLFEIRDSIYRLIN